MKLVIEVYSCLCALSEFTINSVDAEYEDFGTKCDMAPELAEPYGCGDMMFTPDEEPQAGVLNKYGITKKEYREVQNKLQCLSFGSCGWCV